MLAQIKNINADTKGKEIENTNKAEGGVMFKLWTAQEKETLAKEAETWANKGYTEAKTDLTKVETKIAEVNKIVSEATTNEQITKAVKEVLVLNGQYKNLIENAKKTGEETKTIEARREADIKQIWSNIALNEANTNLAEANTRLSEQSKSKLIQDYGISLANLTLNKERLEKVDIQNAKTNLATQLMNDAKWRSEYDLAQTKVMLNALFKAVEVAFDISGE